MLFSVGIEIVKTSLFAYAVADEEGIYRRLFSSEFLIEVHRIDRAAALKHFLELVSSGLIKDSMLLEGCEGIHIQHFRPFVAVDRKSVV